MKIFDLHSNKEKDFHSLSATVAWEDNNRPTVEVFFRVFSHDGFVNASDYNAFLVACIVPALHHGERRIQIDGPVCPWLVDNLITAMAYLNHWYWYEQGARSGAQVTIEPKHYTDGQHKLQSRVATFFSGGVDSLFTLQKNRQLLSEDHPGRIRDIIFLHGFDIYGNRPKRGPELESFHYFVKECEPVAKDVGVNMIPVWTNIRNAGMEDTGFFIRECFGATLGAVAHALSGKLTDILIASSDHIPDLRPWGSSPLIDSRFSSFNLRAHHDAERVSRIEKVQAISEWQIGLEHLRVCFSGGPGTLNCGECEKCVRTKLALLCANKLDATEVFKNKDLNVGFVLKKFTATEASIPYSTELIDALRRNGHTHLARAVIVKRWQYYATKMLNIRELVTWLDRKILGGSLKKRFHFFRQVH